MKNFLLLFFALVMCVSGCQKKGNNAPTEESGDFQVNPAAVGFDHEGSDSIAVAIADEVMFAMGGRKSWDNIRYLSWVFFGGRKHLWDKHTGDIRIESLQDSSVVLMNINNQKGRVLRNGAALTHPDSLSKYLRKGMNQWINDAYWLVMPFKLKDTGVTLRYVGEDTTQLGEPSDILSLTFEGVGVTPNNKYLISVDKKTRLINEWSFFPDTSSEQARFVLPWKNYKEYNKVMLSDDRGNKAISSLEVKDSIDESLLEEF